MLNLRMACDILARPALQVQTISVQHDKYDSCLFMFEAVDENPSTSITHLKACDQHSIVLQLLEYPRVFFSTWMVALCSSSRAPHDNQVGICYLS